MADTVRVRFAPSPTGRLHIGGARTALFNWAYARHVGGVFLLRVEDTDRERSRAEYEAAIFEGLRWLGIDWDEGPDVGGSYGPYRQTERAERHAEYAERLLGSGWAYRCFCSSERLEALREEQTARKQTPAYDKLCRDLAADEAGARAERGEPFVLRFAVPEGQTRFTDLIRGPVAFDNAEVDDWVLVRAEGSPTYNFVVVCDDADMAITLVCRGEEHLTNTPKQVLLYEALELEPPQFAHLPLMLGTDGKKLSKRTGHTALQEYRDEGYPPEAVLNFLSLQGWSLDGETEVFSIDRLVEHFELGDVSKGGAVFDPDKFLWLAGEYVRADTPARLAERCLPFVFGAGLTTTEDLQGRGDWFERVVATEQERIRLYSELPARIAYLFASDDAVAYEDDAESNANKHDPAARLAAYRAWLAPRLESGATVDAPALRDATKSWIADNGLKFPALFQPLRCALTGRAGGPDLFDVMALLGPRSTLARIDAGIARLR